jgi:enediyne biosynthesis protein E4
VGLRAPKIPRRKFLAKSLPLLTCGPAAQCLWADTLIAAPNPQAQTQSGDTSVRPKITFQDIAPQAGIIPKLVCGSPEKNYILEVNGTGCVWFDYNNDGYVDLYIVNGSTIGNLLNGKCASGRPRNYLFRNNGDGTFTDVTLQAGVSGRDWGNGAVAADYNNDGWVDLFVYNFGKNILYRNNGDGTFNDVTAQAAVAGNNLWSAGAAFADYDNDGFLDLYVSGYIDFDIRHPPDRNRLSCTFRGKPIMACGPRGLKGAPDILYHNNGDGTFTDVTAKAGVADKGLYYGFAVAFEDLDGDDRPDIVVMNDSNPNYFYRNKGDGTFEEVGATAGIAYNGEGLEQSNMGLALGDFDNDGMTDLFITTFADDNYTLFHNEGKGLFVDVSYPSGLGEATIPFLGWATFFMDYNNDGWKDLFCVNGHVYPEVDRLFKGASYRQRPLLFENLRNGKFRDASLEVGLGAFQLPGRGGAFCDFDNDGDLDVCIVNIDERPVLLRNDGGNAAGNWLQVKTVGTKSNRDGIGALVKVIADELTQYDRVRTGGSFLSGNDMRLHFGLGEREEADAVEVHWPSGAVDRLTRVRANQVLVVQEGKGQIPSPYRPFLKRNRAPTAGK